MKKVLNLTICSILIAAVYGCNKKDKSGEQTNQTQTAQQESGKTSYVKKATHFTLPDRTGGIIDLADYAGKPVMVVFFAEYCPFCRQAAPFIEKMHKTYKDKSFQTIGIAIEDEKEPAEAFANYYKLTFPIAYKGGETSARYGARGVPYLFVLNKSHEIVNMWAGYHNSFEPAIIKTIEEAIKG
ncbi:MAG: TlpA family protein disulfide reductase [Elusimicrobia bacterium]|nr:TlpA family protein disulfide reductase [Elusimicrobiota bacterium]